VGSKEIAGIAVSEIPIPRTTLSVGIPKSFYRTTHTTVILLKRMASILSVAGVSMAGVNESSFILVHPPG
jgi:hypothetical protein